MVGQRASPLSLPLLAAALLVATLVVPAASAWQLPRPYESGDDTSSQPATGAAWTLWMSPGLRMNDGVAMVAGSLQASVACAVGDLSGDGVADIVVQGKAAVEGAITLNALAGPDFQQVIWTKLSSAQRVLACVPDIDLDGSADIVLQVAAEAQAAADVGGATAQQAQQHAMQVVSGATGLVMMARTATDTASGAAGAAGGAAVAAGSEASAALLPAAAGAAAFVQTQVTQGGLPVPLPVPVPGLPLDSLTATAQSSVRAAILDAQGQVSAVIEISEPATQVLALAPVPLGGGLPGIAVLTQTTVSPAAEVAAQVPSLALYNADGTLAWTTQLAATASAGLPILLPQGGDLNLDGIPDLIVNTVETGVTAVPSAGFSVVSGLDGSILFTSGDAVSGLMAAVPLGSLPTGDAIVQVQAAAGAATMTLSAVTGTGQAVWSVTVDAAAQPLNAAIDAYTGDITGFTDLTGDLVPDVGVLVQQQGSAALQVFDGVTGAVAWNATVEGALSVIPMAQATVAGRINTAVEGTVTDLLVVRDLALSAGADAVAQVEGAAAVATEPALTLLDGATGQVEWTVSTAIAAAGTVQVAVQAAGDLDADGVQDLLATFVPAVTDAASAAASAGAMVDASMLGLSGKTGATLYLNSTGSAQIASATDIVLAEGPAYEGREASVPAGADAESTPAPVAGLVALLLVGLAAFRRRR